jgi:rod shape-determining protein MreB and related proteins
MTRLEKFLRRWRRSPQSSRTQGNKVCLDVGSHTTKLIVDTQAVITCPTCVVRHRATGSILAIGDGALEMLGKLPEYLEVIFPVRTGKIIETEAAKGFIEALLRQHLETDWLKLAFPPVIKLGILFPQQIAQVNAWKQVVRQTSYRCKLLSVPSALWSHLEGQRIFTGEGFVIDIGAMTTKFFLYAEGQIAQSYILEHGGNDWTDLVREVLRRKHQLDVGWQTAEQLKHQAIHFGKNVRKHTVRGKDILSGLPVTKVIEDQIFVEEAMVYVDKIIAACEQLCQSSSSELVARIFTHGVYLTGGASQVVGLRSLLEQQLKVSITASAQPQVDVVKGLSSGK